MSNQGIVLNIFMNKTDENTLFGKVGFQTMGPKTDKIVLANLTKIEEFLDKGLLKDLDDKVVEDNAVIMLYCRVSRPKSADDLPQVAGFVDATGNMQKVAATEKSVDDTEDDIPF